MKLKVQPMWCSPVGFAVVLASAVAFPAVAADVLPDAPKCAACLARHEVCTRAFAQRA